MALICWLAKKSWSTYSQLTSSYRKNQYCQPSNLCLLLLQVYRFVLCMCTCYRIYCSYKCIALYSEILCAIHIVLLVVLCLKEVEFLLYAVTWFTHCELKGLPRLRWTLKQTNRTSEGESTTYIYIPPLQCLRPWWRKRKKYFFFIWSSPIFETALLFRKVPRLRRW
jgi:hypothetical protein